MIHPDTYIAGTAKGIGVFAKRKFKKGEILWIIDDIDAKIPMSVYETLDPIQKAKLEIYSYEDYDKRIIVPWDEGKYVNHSCSPNSIGLLQFDTVSIACRDIEKDEEIVEDYYGYFGHFESFTCSCGSPNCRGVIKKDDTYNSDLRVDLNDFAGLILSMPQLLLEVQSKDSRPLKTFLSTYSQKNGKSKLVRSEK